MKKIVSLFIVFTFLGPWEKSVARSVCYPSFAGDHLEKSLVRQELDLAIAIGLSRRSIEDDTLHRIREGLRLLLEVPGTPEEIIRTLGRPISRQLMENYMHLILRLDLNPLRRAVLENTPAFSRSGFVASRDFGNAITETDYMIILKINQLILSSEYDFLDVHLPKPVREGWVTNPQLFRQFLETGNHPISPENVIRDDQYGKDWEMPR